MRTELRTLRRSGAPMSYSPPALVDGRVGQGLSMLSAQVSGGGYGGNTQSPDPPDRVSGLQTAPTLVKLNWPGAFLTSGTRSQQEKKIHTWMEPE